MLKFLIQHLRPVKPRISSPEVSRPLSVQTEVYPTRSSPSTRLDVHQVGRECSERAWPNFEASCLRGAVSKTQVREVRFVTTDRVR